MYGDAPRRAETDSNGELRTRARKRAAALDT
jgi:hypothetical protein